MKKEAVTYFKRQPLYPLTTGQNLILAPRYNLKGIRISVIS